jgi:hypothetical protein
MFDPLAHPIEPGPHRLQLVAAADPVRDGVGARYRVRAVKWRDHYRFEVRDILTDTTLAIRATQSRAEDDIIVLNVLGATALGYRPVSEPSAVTNMARQLHRARASGEEDRTVESRA